VTFACWQLTQRAPAGSLTCADSVEAFGSCSETLFGDLSIANLAWTVYTDLKKKTPHPSPDVVAQTLRVELRDAGELDPAQQHRIIDIVVDETVQAANRVS
jgi:hypothetical protein